MQLSQSTLFTLVLSSVKGIGLRRFQQLISAFGTVEHIWQTPYEKLVEKGLKPELARAVCNAREKYEEKPYSPVISRIEQWLGEQDKRYLLSTNDDLYPERLKEIYCPSPLLFVEGNIDALSMPSIAIVGSRNASLAGLQHAHQFARDIAANHFSVTSGLALGVDAAAHKGALDVEGVTIAVLATGLDSIYPKKHAGMADQVKERGALVSEMSLGTLPLPANFPRRNRIVSGLSAGVLVVEASLKSGSLITAKYALEQNREVFAIPGAINNPYTKGCHSLIKQGAKLVEESSDIFSELAFLPCDSTRSVQADLFELGESETLVLNKMGYDCIGFDDLIALTGMTMPVLSNILMGLELNGWVATVPGGYQRINQVKSPA